MKGKSIKKEWKGRWPFFCDWGDGFVDCLPLWMASVDWLCARRGLSVSNLGRARYVHLPRGNYHVCGRVWETWEEEGTGVYVGRKVKKKKEGRAFLSTALLLLLFYLTWLFYN
jgi:hypothetical protein